jgi:hypothetical protein
MADPPDLVDGVEEEVEEKIRSVWGDEGVAAWRAAGGRPPVVFCPPTAEEVARTEVELRGLYGDDAPPVEGPLCQLCGWTIGMVCPECAGCGCYTGTCTGWRHGEFAGDDDLDDKSTDAGACEWCGGGPYCTCCPDCGAELVAKCACPITVTLDDGGELVL